jgi:hypothetical protein
MTDAEIVQRAQECVRAGRLTPEGAREIAELLRVDDREAVRTDLVRALDILLG